MPSSSVSPTYNLGAITRETGLNPDTLRAWERRYNLPQPSRSEGGQRLYSQRDLEIVKWLIEQQKAGMRISQAAKLWHDQIAAGIDPLLEDSRTTFLVRGTETGPENFSAYRENWILACLGYDEAKAEQILTEAFSLYPPETVCFEVLLAGLHDIGEGWYQGQVTVQQEHFISALVARRLNALISGTAPPVRTERILVADPAEEEHTLSALMLTYMLRRRGWHVVFLGADVPLRDFKKSIESMNIDLAIMVAQTIATAASLLDYAEILGQLEIGLAFGGMIFNRIPELQDHIPGHYLGEDLQDSMGIIEELITRPFAEIEIPQPNNSKFLEHFQNNISEIDNQLYEALSAHPELSSAPIQYITRDVLAALKLGDVSYANHDLEWVQGMLAHLQIPTYSLTNFLEIYAQVVDDVLGSAGETVSKWLQSEIEHLQSSTKG